MKTYPEREVISQKTCFALNYEIVYYSLILQSSKDPTLHASQAFRFLNSHIFISVHNVYKYLSTFKARNM